MKKEELIKLVDSLNFDKEDYYILSSGCLLLYGLREKANDLDLCISKELFSKIKEKYNLNDENKNENGFYKISDFIEVVVNDKNEFNRNFKNGYPVEDLITMMKYKEKRNLEKDKKDVKNIKKYLYNEIKIRKIEFKDIEQVVDINIKDWEKVYRGIIEHEIINNLNREKKIEKWKKHYNIGNVIVAELNNKILGYCRYDDKANYDNYDIDSEIIALYIDCDNPRFGVGTKIFEYVKMDLKNKDKKNMIIWCLERNKNARKFYEKMGGKTINFERYFEVAGYKYKEIGYKYEI